MLLLTRRDVRGLLADYHLAPRRASGQNFVVEPNTVRKIVRDAGVGARDEVLEIGPGLGSLTLALAERAARVVAVEVDAGLVRALRHVLAGVENVEVVHADALTVDLASLAAGSRVRMVANLPYSIATAVVFAVLEADVIVDAFVMVQREVGERWAARVGHPLYGAVSLKLALYADVALGERVPRTVFYPVPNVDSVMVRLRPVQPVGDALRDRTRRVIDVAFAQRRKTLRNNLVTAFAPPQVDAALAGVGLSGGERAERLELAEVVALTERLDAQDAGRRP